MSAYYPDQPLLVKGFEVEISGSRASDSGWKTVSGGGIRIHESASSPVRRLDAIAEITLQGPLTAGRSALCEWINETAAGRAIPRTVAIRVDPVDPDEPAQTVVYEGASLTRYRLSPLVQAPCPEPPVEEVSFTFARRYPAGA